MKPIEHKNISPEEAYDRSYFEGRVYKGLYRDFPCHWKTVEVIMQRKPGSVLELGGARGYVTKKLESLGVRAVCMDVSKHCWHTRATDSFVLWDATKTPWPFKDKKFDLCFSKDFMEHLPEDKLPDVIREMARVSKRGLHGITFEDHPYARDDPTHLTLRSREWWVNKFKEVAPDYPVEIVDKEDLEKPPYKLPPSDGLVKLNIGSFINMFHYGWVNIDILDLKRYADANGYIFKQVDVTKGLPYKDNSVDLIVAHHLIEHLDRQQGEKFLRECFRVLKPGGLIRLSAPDAELLCDAFLKGKIMEYRHVNVGVEKAQDDAEALYHLLLAGHKTIYTCKSLKKLLKKIGFEDVKCMPFNKSQSDVIEKQTIDPYPTLSFYIEATKPETREVKVVTPRGKKLKIGLISTPFLTTPPRTYGGLERVVADLAEVLAKMGHDVTVFAADGSKVEGCRVVEFGPPLEKVQVDWLQAELKAYQVYKDMLGEFDIIHGHNWFGFEYRAKALNPSLKVMHTHHGGLNMSWWGRAPPPFKLNLVAISMWMRNVYETLGFTAKYVYNGIDLNRYPFKAEKGDRLLFVGRLDRFKQPHVAIEVAKRLGMGLDIVGGSFVQDPSYLNQIKSMCDGKQIKLHLDAPHEVKVELMQDAKALLFPSKMGEPFGLVAVEAMSCLPGDQIILTHLGAIPVNKVTTDHKVLGSNGKFQRVLKKHYRYYDGYIYEIKAVGLLPFKLTEEHPVLVARIDRENHVYIEKFGKTLYRRVFKGYEWKSAKDLKVGDYLVFPKLKRVPRRVWVRFQVLRNTSKSTPEKILESQYGRSKGLLVDKYLMELFGRYLADGCAIRSGIEIAFGSDEYDEAKYYAQIIEEKLGYKPSIEPTSSGYKIRVGSPILARFFRKWFGVHAENKRVPRFVFNSSYTRSFLLGYFKGDGYRDRGGELVFTTVSKTLALQLQQLLSRLGCFASIITIKRKGTTTISGRVVKQKRTIYRVIVPAFKAHVLGFKSKKRYGRYVRIYEDKSAFYVPIKEIKKIRFKGRVFNMTTEDSTFQVSNIIVHNCGTPVVAFRDGAIPEVVEHGVSGFVVDTVDEMVEAVKKVDEIKPVDCRRRAELFSREHMAENYLNLYRLVLEGAEW